MSNLQVPVGKQRDFIIGKPARINLLYGSVRSTKTWAVNIKILKDIITLPDGNILFVGNTGTSLYRNVLTPLKDLVGKAFKKYFITYKKSVKLIFMAFIFD